jgi:hypothetical protein
VRELPEDAPLAKGSVPGCDVSVIEWKPSRRVLRVTSAEECNVEIRTFAFPGWEASVDSFATPVKVNEGNGEIVVRVPAGQHELSLIFTDTPIRRTARSVSVVTLLILLAAITASLFKSRLARTGTFLKTT